MDKNKAAVVAMLDQAQAAATLEAMRGRLEKLTGEDFPAVACLLDLLAEHPTATGDNTIAGAVAAIRGVTTPSGPPWPVSGSMRSMITRIVSGSWP